MSMDEREFFIFGEPVETELGKVRFLTYKEYLLHLSELSLITLNVLHLYYRYMKQIDKNDKDALEALERFKELSLHEIVVNDPSFVNNYAKMFEMVIEPSPHFQGNVFEQIFKDKNLFMYYRDLIMSMNLLSEEEVSPNPEIQKFIEMKQNVHKPKEESSFTDIVSSIVAGTSNTFKDVCNMTVFQVYAVYYRMGAIFDYNTSTLFATVSEKVKIESWGRHLDLFNKDDGTIKKDKFDKKFGSML